MIFKRPYAFFIKYFRHINFILSILLIYFTYKLNIIHQVLNDIYSGNLTNYSNLNANYISFRIYLLIFFICILIISIIVLLRRKKKPLKDYLFAIIYIIILLIYLFVISDLFFTLSNVIVEHATLKVYSDISLLIIIPLIYFIIKFILIAIGFNLKKFNFTKDIIELKQEEKDNEEVELILSKNTYKYKRNIRRWFREFKYYLMENKLVFIIIISILGILLVSTFFSLNLFNKDKVNIGESFNAGGFNYKVLDIYETKYDLNNNIIDENNKFVIVSLNIRNNNSLSKSIDLERIRLLYGDEYVYANNYFNKYFYDLGIPYNKEPIKSNVLNEYIIIFKIPNNYKSNKYKLKFYDRVINNENELVGSYKEISVKAERLNNNSDRKELKLNENTVFDKKSYGSSNLTILNYSIENSYIYKNDNKNIVVKDKDINKVLLLLDYKLELDEDYIINNYFSNDKEFFNKFTSIEYTYNSRDKVYYNVSALSIVGNKVIISIPYEVKNASNINLVFNFRTKKIVYKLK
ncbi:MAG: hypothetical protein IJD92_04985 [Bacilli bacterium]|nr:hypothetical protein [Bacilli bacterium]